MHLHLSYAFSRLIPIFALLLKEIASLRTQQSYNIEEDELPDNIRCYSCMSDLYRYRWKDMSRVYQAPQNVTSLCDIDVGRERDMRGISMVACPSICLTITELVSIAGMEKYASIRGCFDTMLKRSFNRTMVHNDHWMRRDSCNYYNSAELLMDSERSMRRSVLFVCRCYGDACNHYKTSSRAARHSGANRLFCLLWLFPLSRQHFYSLLFFLLLAIPVQNMLISG